MPPTAEQIAIEIKTAFEQFKAHNDERLAELEQRGAASPETLAAVTRANEDITRLQSAIDDLRSKQERDRLLVEQMENRLNRPRAGGGNGMLKIADDRRERYAAFQSAVQGKGEVDPAHVDLEFIGAYIDAFQDYVKRGPRASGDHLRLLNEMSVGSDPGGGYWVDPDTSGRIVEFIHETTPLRRLASVTTIDAGDALEGDYDLQEAGTGGWVGEGGSRPGNTDTPEIWGWRIPVREQYAEPRTTQRYLDQTRRSGTENWLIGKAGRRFGRDENTAFVSGNAPTRPRGFLTYAAGTPATTSPAAYTVIQQVNSAAAGGLTADGLIDLVFALKPGYRANARFGGNRTTEAEVRKLKDGQGQYLWQPDFTERAAARLLGFPWEDMPDMPSITAGAEPIVFADFQQAYQIVDQGGIRVLRDDLTLKGKVKFYMTKYVGGDVVDFDALKLQTISA